MSEFRGFKCDICGGIYETGIRMKGDKRIAIENGRTRYGYRIDFCDRCFKNMMDFCKRPAFDEAAGRTK